MNSQQELLDAINTISQKKERSFDTPATVLRVEGDIVWVHIDGGADETPVQKTINCSEGETVQVRISNGSAFLVGNASAPPTDDKTANVAHFVAEQADIKAVKAEETATEAQATAAVAQETAEEAMTAAAQSLTTYETWYILSATTPTQPTESSHSGWSTTEPAWSSSSTDNLYFSVRTVKGDGTATWSAVGMVQSYADLQILKNAIISTVASDYVAQGSSNVTSLSSTMIQNVNGVNIFNNTLAVGDSYAHIDGGSFDIKTATSAGTIDDANDTVIASFGREVTVGTRASGVEGQYSQVFGIRCIASGDYSHAEGFETEASGMYSHTEGSETEASGPYSHTEGSETEASAWYSHAEGFKAKAQGIGSHAEGLGTEASGDYSHAEGASNASGDYSHSEGASNASGDYSHAEGTGTEASGDYSHAEGSSTTASGDYSHAQNYLTEASSACQTVIGKINIIDSQDVYALIIGNGSDEQGIIRRSDALRVKWDGSVIDGNGNKISPTILESSDISASATTYTFTDDAITADSTIDVYDSIFGFVPSNITTSAGSCTITFPAQSSSHKIRLFVY